ncbi:MAG: hypothetical protein ACLQPD_20585 [Desulfomonilaceae bacterium]
MKSLSILMLALALTLTMISLTEVFAQDDSTITDCQSRCGTVTWTGQVTGNPQAIAACRDRCARQFWSKTEGQQKNKAKVCLMISSDLNAIFVPV